MSAAHYQELAESQRLQAEQASLPLVRQSHEVAADKWDRIAEQLEHCERGPLNWKGQSDGNFY